MDVVKPIFGRVGGKARLAPWIIEFIKQHQFSIYCEPFAGSAAVYFRMIGEGIFEAIKERGHHPRIVLNDADSRIVQLFRTCRDYPELLAHAVKYTPYSREEHRIAQGKQDVESDNLDDLLTEIEKARRMLVDSWQSFKYMPGDSWGITRFTDRDQGRKIPQNVWMSVCDRILAASPHLQNNAKLEALELAKVLLDLAGSDSEEEKIKQEVEKARRMLVDSWQSFSRDNGGWSYLLETNSSNTNRDKIGDRCASARFNSLPDRIETATSHLKRCYIENDDAVNVIQRWATPYTLFYLDPPYVDCENYYAHNNSQTKDQNLELHYRLAEIANTVECAGVIISYYPNELLDELYPEENWERHYKETVASSAGVTRTSKTKTKPKRMELLLVRKNRSESVDTPKSNYTGQLNLF